MIRVALALRSLFLLLFLVPRMMSLPVPVVEPVPTVLTTSTFQQIGTRALDCLAEEMKEIQKMINGIFTPKNIVAGATKGLVSTTLAVEKPSSSGGIPSSTSLI